MNWRFAAANNFSRELTAGFCIYQQQQQENNNLEPATPSMLGVALKTRKKKEQTSSTNQNKRSKVCLKTPVIW